MKKKHLLGLGVVALAGAATYFLVKEYKKRSAKVLTIEEIENIIDSKHHRDLQEAIKADEENLELSHKELKERARHLKKGQDPSSLVALNTFISMHLADLDENTIAYRGLEKLFGIEFEPSTRGDIVLHNALKTERADFFGLGSRSKWIDNITWADVVVFYAEKLEYHLGYTNDYWIGYIIDCMDIDSKEGKELEYTLNAMADHDYINDDTETFGIFGIDADSMGRLEDQVIHAVDKAYTFDMELSAALHMFMERDEEEDY